jgi:lipopolysaccharide transport system ATP-binding protein
MAEIVIQVKSVCKSYNLSSSGSISGDLNNWILSKKSKKIVNKFWALQDINFDVRQGERLAITGDNGAGKSTLLKILSKITRPTKGIIVGKGKITSMLEVGTGFHPELSGIENIFLNGAMLGMSRRDISIKIDEIVAFSEISEHINMPVKRYSTGMYMRLAFATATHLQSEIVIIDEVLAVGDDKFKHKSLDKLKSLSIEFGKTVILVSHDQQHINSFCNKEIKLSNGLIL